MDDRVGTATESTLGLLLLSSLAILEGMNPTELPPPLIHVLTSCMPLPVLDFIVDAQSRGN